MCIRDSIYTFQGATLDVHFIGFLFLLIVTVALATTVKSVETERALKLLGSERQEEDGPNQLSTKTTIALCLSLLCIMVAGVNEYFVLAFLIALIALATLGAPVIFRLIEYFEKRDKS